MNIITNKYKNCFNGKYNFYNKMEKELKQFITRCRKNDMKTREIVDLINKHYVLTDNEIIDILDIICREGNIEINSLIEIINKKYKLNINSLNYFFNKLKFNHETYDVLALPLHCLISYTDTLAEFMKFSINEQKIQKKIDISHFLYKTALNNEKGKI